VYYQHDSADKNVYLCFIEISYSVLQCLVVLAIPSFMETSILSYLSSSFDVTAEYI